MHCLHSFLNAIWFSCTSPATYHIQFVKESWKQSLRYLYFFLVLLVALQNLPAALSLAQAVPTVKIAIQDFEEKAPSIFPDNLVITVKNGVAKTNVREPFAITLPKQWMDSLHSAFPDTPEFKNFLLLHTRAKSDDFPLYRSALLLTRNALIISKNGKSFRSFPLQDFPDDLIINAETYALSLLTISRLLALLPHLLSIIALLMVIVFPFLKAFLLSIGFLLLLLPLSLLPFALAIHLGKHLSFANVYRLSFHGLTLPILLRTFETPVFGSSSPFSLPILYLLFLCIVLCQFPRWKPQHSSQNRAIPLQKPKKPKTAASPLPPPSETV